MSTKTEVRDLPRRDRRLLLDVQASEAYRTAGAGDPVFRKNALAELQTSDEKQPAGLKKTFRVMPFPRRNRF